MVDTRRNILGLIMKKLTIYILTFFMAGSILFTAIPNNTQAATSGRLFAACSSGGGGLRGGFFTPWYAYLPSKDDSTGKCVPQLPSKGSGIDVKQSVLLILVAVMELLTKLAGLIAVGYIIYGAVQYMTSQGEPQNITKAKTTITNALVGFIITVLAVALVQFLGRTFS